MNDIQKRLREAACEAAGFAYAPYSKFKVGAAVLTDAGIYYGANIENASSNLGICAERVALAHARMNGVIKVIGIAVCCASVTAAVAAQMGSQAFMPCGGCRQWLAELAPEAWLVTNADETVYRVDELLPLAFQLEPIHSKPKKKEK